jgi:hypothetical protein
MRHVRSQAGHKRHLGRHTGRHVAHATGKPPPEVFVGCRGLRCGVTDGQSVTRSVTCGVTRRSRSHVVVTLRGKRHTSATRHPGGAVGRHAGVTLPIGPSLGAQWEQKEASREELPRATHRAAHRDPASHGGKASREASRGNCGLTEGVSGRRKRHERRHAGNRGVTWGATHGQRVPQGVTRCVTRLVGRHRAASSAANVAPRGRHWRPTRPAERDVRRHAGNQGVT